MERPLNRYRRERVTSMSSDCGLPVQRERHIRPEIGCQLMQFGLGKSALPERINGEKRRRRVR